MSYIEIFDLLVQALSDTSHDLEQLKAKCDGREWARATAYTRAIRNKLVRIDAMIQTCDLIDRSRPPTQP